MCNFTEINDNLWIHEQSPWAPKRYGDGGAGATHVTSYTALDGHSCALGVLLFLILS
jgi:hypothetical protein